MIHIYLAMRTRASATSLSHRERPRKLGVTLAPTGSVFTGQPSAAPQHRSPKKLSHKGIAMSSADADFFEDRGLPCNGVNHAVTRRKRSSPPSAAAQRGTGPVRYCPRARRPPTCWSTGRICESSRNCWATPASAPPKSIPTSPLAACARCTGGFTFGDNVTTGYYSKGIIRKNLVGPVPGIGRAKDALGSIKLVPGSQVFKSLLDSMR